MGLPLSLLSWRSTHELFHRKSLRRSAVHLARIQWNKSCSRRLKSLTPMMPSEIIAHVPRVTFDQMSSNNVQKQENQSAQTVVQKDTHVGHSWPWPSRNIVQTRRYH